MQDKVGIGGLEITPQRLADDEVHLWQVDLPQVAVKAELLQTVLEPAERRRASAFRLAADREQYIITRGLLRLLLEAYGVAAAAEVRFEYSRHGKPRLADRRAADRLQFSVSHTCSRSVLAFGRSDLLGVDVERCIELKDRNELAASSFSPREFDEYQSLEPFERLQGFYNAWTRKEAFIKATGEGLSRRLDSFSVTVSPGRDPQVVEVDGSSSAATAWTLYDPNRGYSDSFALALAVRSAPLRVTLRHFAAPM
jgi:4'-phosphopantetheinyl transferase